MRKIILTRRARDLAALRADVDILKAAVLDLDRRLRVLEHGAAPGSWPRDVAEFHRHVTHTADGIEVVR
jgi:hypothetical protein